MRIPHDILKPDTLRAVIEEFVTREGTEYGDADVSLDDKVAAVVAQLEAGTAVVLYDDESTTCTIARTVDVKAAPAPDLGPTIQLDQFLKREGLTETGGHAKHVIQGGEVRVNGDVETRRKRKLRSGDRVALGDRELIVSI